MQTSSADDLLLTDSGDAEARRTQLQRLLPLWPKEISDGSLDNRRRIVRLLARALREERRRGVSGHWAYDLARHAALARLYRQECEALHTIQRTARPNPASKT